MWGEILGWGDGSQEPGTCGQEMKTTKFLAAENSELQGQQHLDGPNLFLFLQVIRLWFPKNSS